MHWFTFHDDVTGFNLAEFDHGFDSLRYVRWGGLDVRCWFIDCWEGQI